MARQIESMITDPDASTGYVTGLAKTAVGAIAVGGALGFGLWSARTTSDMADDASQEATSGFAFGGNL